jgi:L-ascorbate metabolism protein UlaG (beta-lactamase superfamily)
MGISYRWLGNAGFEFKSGKNTLLVDPFLTCPKPSQIYFGRVNQDQNAIKAYIGDCSHILVSHTHFDHFMDVPEIAKRTGAVLHGSLNTCELAFVMGVPEDQLNEINAGDEFLIGGARVKAIPAAHPWIPGYTRGRLKKGLKPPLRLSDYRMDSCLSFLISFQGRRILVWNSTHVEDAEPADILICRAISNQCWYARMMEIVRPELVIPSHWNDIFTQLSRPVQPFFSAPRLAIPPVQRIDLGEFVKKIIKAKRECQVLLPERFCEGTLL